MSGRLDGDAIRAGLRIERVGRRIVCCDELDSTNLEARRQIERSGRAADGLVIMTELQSAGRGRLGRAWHSPRGASLLMTAVLFEPTEEAIRLVLASAVAAARAVRAVTDVGATVRWPNDVYVRTRKLGGILVEAVTQPDESSAFAIGVGINCLQHAAHFPPELRHRATSLELESAHAVDRGALAKAVILAFDEWLPHERASSPRVIEEWSRLNDDLGRRIELSRDGHDYAGTVLEIDPNRGLLVQLDEGGRELFDPFTTTRRA